MAAAGKTVLPAEVEVLLSPAAFDAMKANPQAAATSLRDGFAAHVGLSPGEVVISDIDPPIGEFDLAYGFRRLLQRIEAVYLARALQEATVSLLIKYDLAIPQGEVDTISETLLDMAESEAQTTALTNSINSNLESNIGVEALVTGATVNADERGGTPQPPPDLLRKDDSVEVEDSLALVSVTAVMLQYLM